MKGLSPAQLDRARAFLETRARPLEQARYAYHFAGGAVDAVCDELAHFQNGDGGFGHALEPDLRTPVSSVLATTTALQFLREIHAPPDHDLVRGAVRYLVATYDPAIQGWPIIPPAAEDAPHAPWWNQDGLAERFGGFALNPTAEVLGHLFVYGGLEAVGLCAAVIPAVMARVEAHAAAMDMNDFHCCLRLADTPSFPEPASLWLRMHLVGQLQRIVSRDRAAWNGYVFYPLHAAERPDVFLAPYLANSIQQNLDFVIDQQGADGAWGPTWSWFGQYPDRWPAAEQDWKGVLTLERLLWLRGYGRLAQ